MFYFYLKCLSSSWVLVPTGSLLVVPGDPAGPSSSVSCLDLQHPPGVDEHCPGSVSLLWSKFTGKWETVS